MRADTPAIGLAAPVTWVPVPTDVVVGAFTVRLVTAKLDMPDACAWVTTADFSAVLSMDAAVNA